MFDGSPPDAQSHPATGKKPSSRGLPGWFLKRNQPAFSRLFPIFRRRTSSRRRSLLLLKLFICLLSACNAAVPVETPPVTAENTSRPRPTLRTPTATAARVTTDEPQGSPFIWPTPPPSPVAACPGTPRARLIVQQRGRVLPDDPLPIRLREAPGVDQHIVTLIPIRELFLVLDGPVCNGSYTWFKIRYNDQEGWIAEGTITNDGNTSYFVEPYFPG